jgi:hypothetical protein
LGDSARIWWRLWPMPPLPSFPLPSAVLCNLSVRLDARYAICFGSEHRLSGIQCVQCHHLRSTARYRRVLQCGDAWRCTLCSKTHVCALQRPPSHSGPVCGSSAHSSRMTATVRHEMLLALWWMVGSPPHTGLLDAYGALLPTARVSSASAQRTHSAQHSLVLRFRSACHSVNRTALYARQHKREQSVHCQAERHATR